MKKLLTAALDSSTSFSNQDLQSVYEFNKNIKSLKLNNVNSVTFIDFEQLHLSGKIKRHNSYPDVTRTKIFIWTIATTIASLTINALS